MRRPGEMYSLIIWEDMFSYIATGNTPICGWKLESVSFELYHGTEESFLLFSGL